MKNWLTRPVFSGGTGTKKTTALWIKILIAVVVLVAIVYAIFAPSVFVMANGYMLYPAGKGLCMLKEPGGRVLAQGDLYFAGKYPWLTGWEGENGVPSFILNLETHTFSKVPKDMTEGEFVRFCNEHGCRFSEALNWGSLYPEKDTEKTKAVRASFKAGLQKNRR